MAKINELFAAAADRQTPGAALAVLQDGEMLLERYFGCADLQHRVPVSADSLFGIGLAMGDHLGRRTVSHGGGLNGFSAEYMRFPSERLAVLVQANLGGFGSSDLAVRFSRQDGGNHVRPS